MVCKKVSFSLFEQTTRLQILFSMYLHLNETNTSFNVTCKRHKITTRRISLNLTFRLFVQTILSWKYTKFSVLVYNAFINSGSSASWCHNNLINNKSLTRAVEIRRQLNSYAKKFKIQAPPLNSTKSNAGDSDAIRKAILSGFFCKRSQAAAKWFVFYS